jgi:hypothetical protein
MNQRLTAYRRLASARDIAEVDRLLEEMRDRYGPPPISVQHLAVYARIRLMSDRLGLESLDREGQVVVLKFRPDARIDPGPLMKLVESRGDLTLLPPAVLRLDLGRSPSSPKPPVRPVGPVLRRPGGPQFHPETGRKLATAPDPHEGEGSWWTQRATADVAPGFTRSDILAEVPPDPAAPGGLFERTGALLSQLSQTLVAS